MIASLHIRCDWCETSMSYEEDEPELEAASDGWIFVQVMGNDNLEEFHFCSEDCMNAYF